MGYYEPQWSTEEQTMIDMMELNGCAISPNINKGFTSILLYDGGVLGRKFIADTSYEAIRKCFAYWEKNNAKN